MTLLLLCATQAYAATVDQPSEDIKMLAISTQQDQDLFSYTTRFSVLLKEAAARNSNAMGLVVVKKYKGTDYGQTQDEIRVTASELLGKAVKVRMKNGETGLVYTLSKQLFVWSGSMSSSTSYYYEVKPYLEFLGNGTIYHNWDRTPGNYEVYFRSTNFNRSSELLGVQDTSPLIQNKKSVYLTLAGQNGDRIQAEIQYGITTANSLDYSASPLLVKISAPGLNVSDKVEAVVIVYKSHMDINNRLVVENQLDIARIDINQQAGADALWGVIPKPMTIYSVTTFGHPGYSTAEEIAVLINGKWYKDPQNFGKNLVFNMPM
jgi:hypothetical protein